MPIILPSSHDGHPVVYDVAVYGGLMDNVGDEGKEVSGLVLSV